MFSGFIYIFLKIFIFLQIDVCAAKIHWTTTPGDVLGKCHACVKNVHSHYENTTFVQVKVA